VDVNGLVVEDVSLWGQQLMGHVPRST
jgi:hypothetical protein